MFISPSEIPSLLCDITDTYQLSHEDALIIREIVYCNPSSAPVRQPVELDRKIFTFFRKCEGFKATIDGCTQEFSLRQEKYNTNLRFDQAAPRYLEPNEKMRVRIECIWRGFSSQLDDCYYSFQYDDACTYGLKIENLHVTEQKSLFSINGERPDGDQYRLDENSISFEKRRLEGSESVSYEVLLLPTPKALDTLESCRDKTPDLFCGNIIFVIQHLLGDFVHLAEAFVKGGVAPEDIYIVGIPYSTKRRTVSYLRKSGFNNVVTPTEYPFEDVAGAELQKAIDKAEQSGKKIIIVEDGGYAVPIIHRQHRDKIGLFIGAVEQTANGLWRDRKVESECGLLLPVLNVAESKIKADLESPLIGRAVCRNLELLAGRMFTSPSGKTVGVVGYGRTGSEIAKSLRKLGAKVKIYTTKSAERTSAGEEGFIVSQNHVELVSGSRVVIEATGDVWAKDEEIAAFDHGAWFVSGSSKRLGLDYSIFEALTDSDRTVQLVGVGKRYTLRGSAKMVLLVADGYPINFFGAESVPDKKIEFIPTLLLKCAEYLSTTGMSLPKEIVAIEGVAALSAQVDNIAKRFEIFNRS